MAVTGAGVGVDYGVVGVDGVDCGVGDVGGVDGVGVVVTREARGRVVEKEDEAVAVGCCCGCGFGVASLR